MFIGSDGPLSGPEINIVGDGVADDTAALQAWLNSPDMHREMRGGRYRITSGLTSSVANRTIDIGGATILADTSDIAVLTVSGANTSVKVAIDGNNKAAIGVEIDAPGCKVQQCDISNLYGISIGACGVRVTSTGGCTVSNNVIKNISAAGDATLGNNIGSARAILLNITAAATERNVISDNLIDGVQGEEGDAIQILCNDGTLPFLDGKTSVARNDIRNFNRRGIKIQASNVTVDSNILNCDLALGSLPNAQSCINVITSDNVAVTNNAINAPLLLGIYIEGTSSYTLNSAIVRRNVIKTGNVAQSGNRTGTYGIYVNYANKSVFSDNEITEGISAISIDNSTNCMIDENVSLDMSSSTTAAINITAACSGIFVRDNVTLSGSALYVVQNAAPNCVVTGNHARSSGGGIRSYSTAAGTIYRDNTSNANTTYVGDFTDQYVEGGRNVGSGGVTYPSVIFTADIPTTTNPNRHFNRGDIAYLTTPSASGMIGWVCVTSGTPGTWKTFGAIAA